ncbi:hypothetical protein T4E_10883 [Trichinella pseudospiralis]|uniref:Uncharacterized protein n=1 Tax=Trichinella pseudospiralis TaxID=6337 RepID=A0A0V0XKY3_TRIPS|nr:hypothetical protein T4E_10883 [Trichinella pseudospiralis]
MRLLMRRLSSSSLMVSRTTLGNGNVQLKMERGDHVVVQHPTDSQLHLLRGDSVSVLVVELEFCNPLYTTIFSWVSFTPRGDCAR